MCKVLAQAPAPVLETEKGMKYVVYCGIGLCCSASGGLVAGALADAGTNTAWAAATGLVLGLTLVLLNVAATLWRRI